MTNCAHGVGAVLECSESKQWIREENTFRPGEFGPWKYVPQCRRCAKRGQARRSPAAGDPIVSSEEANALKLRCENEQKTQREQARLDWEQKQRDEKEQWWANYTTYLQTPEWRTKSKAVVARDPVCKGCGKRPSVQAHHMTYANVGNEFLFELVGVCSDCHDRFHKRGRYTETEAIA